MDMKNKTDILDVKNISFLVILIYRELWGNLSLEDVQEIYKTDGMDRTQYAEN
jgi:hypothetical protein